MFQNKKNKMEISKTFRIVGVINSGVETFKIQELKGFWIFSYWKDLCVSHENYENGKLVYKSFKTYAEIEGYLFLKNKQYSRVQRSGNVYYLFY